MFPLEVSVTCLSEQAFLQHWGCVSPWIPPGSPCGDETLCAFWLPTKYPAEPPLQKHVLRAGARQTACWELPRLPCAGVDLCRGTGSPHTYFGSPLSGEGIFVRGFSTRGGCWESLRLATSWDLDVSASILGVSTLYFPADILGLGLFFAQNSRWYHAQAGSA